MALAILLEFTTPLTALKNYGHLKWDIIAKLPRQDFEQEIDIGPYLD